MADHYFTFIERDITVRFFEENPVEVGLYYCDEIDRQMDELSTLIAGSAGYDEKYAFLEAAAGADAARALMERADRADDYAITQILLYLHREYLAGRSKNLLAASRGVTTGSPETLPDR